MRKFSIKRKLSSFISLVPSGWLMEIEKQVISMESQRVRRKKNSFSIMQNYSSNWVSDAPLLDS